MSSSLLILFIKVKGFWVVGWPHVTCEMHVAYWNYRSRFFLLFTANLATQDFVVQKIGSSSQRFYSFVVVVVVVIIIFFFFLNSFPFNQHYTKAISIHPFPAAFPIPYFDRSTLRRKRIIKFSFIFYIFSLINFHFYHYFISPPQIFKLCVLMKNGINQKIKKTIE